MASRPETSDKGLAALVDAQTRFLEWLRGPTSPSEAPRLDRKAFNRLAAAARDLDGALGPFLGASAHASALLGAMQEAEGFTAPRGEYRSRLDALPEVLLLLRLASAARGGVGLHSDPRVRVWIWFAADSWASALGELPSGAERGRFWRALRAFKGVPGAPGDADPMTPAVGRDAVVAALRDWRANRVLSQDGVAKRHRN